MGPMCSSVEMELCILCVPPWNGLVGPMCFSVEMDFLVLCVPLWKWTCGSYGFLCGSGFVGSTCTVFSRK